MEKDSIGEAIEIKEVEHRIQYEDREQENTYRTCCGAMSDRRLLTFIATLNISLLVLTFSCYMLATNKDCTAQHTYVGLVTLIIGIWLKSPI